MKLIRASAVVILLAVVGLGPASISATGAGNGNHVPDRPIPTCADLQVPPGNEVFFHVYARGVQKYRWNGEAWVFVAPDATLFADEGYHAQVGIHYAGPTWESNSGSLVKAVRRDGCPSPDPTAVDWLLLEATSTNGPGVFSSATFIQRVNTAGGRAPAAPGSSVNEAAEVFYTAEYYFYRAEN